MPADKKDFESGLVGKEAIKAFEDKIIEAFEGKLLVVFFYALWCAPCIRMIKDGDKLPQVLRESSESVTVCMVDVDRSGNDAVARKFHICAVPGFVFIKDGEEVDRIIGKVDGKLVLRYIKKYL